MKPGHIFIAVLSGAVLAMPAAGDVIYSNLQDIAIPANFAGVYLDVDTGSWNTNINSPQSGWDINPFFGGSELWNSPAFQPVRSGTGNSDAVLNLAAGTTVGSGSTYSTFVQGAGGENPGGPGYGISETHMGGAAGQFTSGQEGYLGFRTGSGNYGWMRVVLTNDTGGALIKEWGFDNSGASIAVGNVKRTDADVTLDSTFGSFTIASSITNSSGTTNVVKSGSGITTMTGTHSYTGDTTVSQGTLVVNGNISTSPLVTVNSGATLQGSGSTGAVNVQSGGFISSGTGAGAGNLSVGGDLTLSGTYLWDLVALSTASPGTNFDAITMTAGNADITGATLGLNLGSNAPSADAFWQSDQTWTGILNNTGGGSLTGNFAAIDNSSWAGYGGFSTTNTGNDVNLVWTAVPEPRAALLGGLGMIALLRRRRA